MKASSTGVPDKQKPIDSPEQLEKLDIVNSLKNECYQFGVNSNYIFDMSNGYFSYVDEYFYAITGYHPIEVIHFDRETFLSKIICEEHLLVIPLLIENTLSISKEFSNKKIFLLILNTILFRKKG